MSKKKPEPVTKGIAKVPVVMQLEALECGAACLCMVMALFDEATSALDNLTQKHVSEALDRMNCTRIVIAHRLSTIRQCDRILMLEDGKIIEDGSYDELLKKNGKFAEMVAGQRLDC